MTLKKLFCNKRLKTYFFINFFLKKKEILFNCLRIEAPLATTLDVVGPGTFSSIRYGDGH